MSSGSPVPFQLIPPLVVNDVMSATLSPGMGDGIGLSFAALNPNAGAQWSAQTSYSIAPDGLQFCRFCENGTVRFGAKAVEEAGRSDWAGWALQPRYVWLDTKVGGAIDTPATDQNFESIIGTWRTVPQVDVKRATGIYNVKSGGGGKSVVRSVGEIPRNRSLCFYLDYVGQESDETEMDSRVEWGGVVGGDKYSLYLDNGQSIGLEKWNAILEQWDRVFSFDTLPPADLGRGKYLVNILRISGRIVVMINGAAFWNVQRKESDVQPYGGGTAREVTPLDVNWGKGKITVENNNAKCRFEMGVIKYSDPDGEPYTGSFTRSISRPGGVPDGEVEAHTSGWKKEGVKIQITVAGSSYSCLMTASADGIDTPFLSKVLLYLEGTYTTPSATTLDISGAVRKVTVTQQLPTQDARTGSRANIEIDMVSLREICRAGDIPSLSYATLYRRLNIKVRWIKDDGTPNGGYTTIFHGLTTNFSESLIGFATHTRILSAEDDLLLLDKPAALIDQRYAPLDLFYCRKADIAFSNIDQQPNPNGAALYGYECVQEIIRTELGSATANSMQVFLPPSHYPLVDARTDRCGYLAVNSALTNGDAPYQNGFLFPPPFGECALDWIRKSFCEPDHAVLFMTFPEDDRTETPVLTYARLQYWLNTSGRVTWDAPDNLYSAGDIERLMENLELETRADRDYNHIAAWSSPQQGETLGGLLPAMRVSEAYVRTGNNRAPLSWRRSYLIQNPVAWYGGAGTAGVDAIAQIVRNEIEGMQLLWPSTSVPGNPLMAPGDKLRIKRELGGLVYGPSGDVSRDYSSPAGFDGLSELVCRIEQVVHEITLENEPTARRFVTKPSIRPLLNSE